MIEINLLPAEVKENIARQEAGPPLAIYLIPLVVLLMLIIHLLLGVAGIARQAHLTMLKQEWQGLAQQRKQVDSFKKEHALMSQDIQDIKRLLEKRISWAEKLSRLCVNLPSEIWLDELSLSKTDFLLKGSVFSLQKTEVKSVNGFLDHLKKDEQLSAGLSHLQLGPIKNRQVGSYDVLDFSILGVVGSDEKLAGKTR